MALGLAVAGDWLIGKMVLGWVWGGTSRLVGFGERGVPGEVLEVVV